MPGYSISELLSDKELLDKNREFNDRIQAVRQILQDETGIPGSDIYPVPIIFETGVCWGLDDAMSPERNCSKSHAAAL